MVDRIDLGQIGADKVVVDPKRQVLYVACTPRKRLSCAADGQSGGTASVLVVDLGAKKVTKTFPLKGETAGSVALDPGLDTLYVQTSGGDSGQVDVIDLNAGTVGIPLSPGGRVAVDTSTHVLYAGSSVYDGKTHDLSGSIAAPQDSGSLAVDSAHKRLYVGHGLGSSNAGVAVFDTTTNQQIADIAVQGGSGGGFAEDVAVDPNTQTVYAADSYYGRVQVIDGVSKTFTKTIEVTNVPQRLAIDPGWSLIYAVSNNGGINKPEPVKIVDVGAGNLTASIDVGHVAMDVSVDPDKHTAYVLDHDARTVGVSVIASR